jgi:hypothetical protein
MRNLLLLPLVVLAALALTSASKCQSKSLGAKPFVGIETGNCFGYCPVFKLNVLTNGLVRYEGIRFVSKPGRDSFNLTCDELKQLKIKVKAVNLWQYPDQIETRVADAQPVTLSITEGGKTKSVRGTADRPAPLLELEDLLKNLAQAHGINVRDGLSPNAPPANEQTLLVKLKPAVNAGNWLPKYDDIRLRLVRRTSGTDNIWVLGFDPAQVKENQLIELLKGLDGVLDVQPNRAAKERD